MKKKFKIFIIVIFGLFIFFVLLKGLDSSGKYSAKNISKKIDLDMSLKSFDSEKKFSIKELVKKDDIFLINIWASWCLPCREEHFYLIKLKNRNLNIIGFNYKDKKNNAKLFIEDLGNPYSKILVDKDGTKSIELGAIGVPETYLVKSSNSKILKKYIGPLDQQKFNEIIRFVQK
tara:strand:- start:191 stop:715 length:525 start_codon:yes stop_codon:yes gene_type:complete